MAALARPLGSRYCFGGETAVISDNETLGITLFSDAGNMIDGVGWDEARDRIVAFLRGDGTSAEGYWENRAEDILCAIFTGATAPERTRS